MNVATLEMASIEFAAPASSVAQRLKYSLAMFLSLGAFTSALFLGWGWEDVLQLFSHPARATLLAALLIQLAFAVAQARPPGPSANCASGYLPAIVFWLMITAGLLVVASSAFWDRRILFVLPGDDLTRYAGLGLFLMGLAINAWPRKPIGRWQNYASTAGPLWQGTGLRIVVRRPVYPGLMMAVIGLPMAFLSQVGLAGSICLVSAMTVRLMWSAEAASNRERSTDQKPQAA